MSQPPATSAGDRPGSSADEPAGRAGDLVVSRYPMAPLIRLTLLFLYLALVLPLPLLAPASLRWPMGLALPLGLVLLLAITSEQVEMDGEGLRVGHPDWCAWLLRRGWQLPWQQIIGLTAVPTSQGGRVHYVRSRGGQAWLLPQRVARFDDFLQRFSQHSGISTQGISRLTPPWTYQLLAVLTGLMLAIEAGALLRWGLS